MTDMTDLLPAESQERLAALGKAQLILGPNALTEEKMRVAEWLLTGALPINPDRLEQAAQVLAHSQGAIWEELMPGGKDQLRGAAMGVITAYHRQ